MSVTESGTPKSGSKAKASDGAGEAESTPIARTPIWPDYFARLGQPDAANWQYEGLRRGHREGVARLLLARDRAPLVSLRGDDALLQSLIYRVTNEDTGRPRSAVDDCTHSGWAWPSPPSCRSPRWRSCRRTYATCATPTIPPLFEPFTFMGWANYNVMLVTMFTMHCYKQPKMGWSPAQALRHSSKVFWHDFFEQHLPEGHRVHPAVRGHQGRRGQGRHPPRRTSSSSPPRAAPARCCAPWSGTKTPGVPLQRPREGRGEPRDLHPRRNGCLDPRNLLRRGDRALRTDARSLPERQLPGHDPQR